MTYNMEHLSLPMKRRLTWQKLEHLMTEIESHLMFVDNVVVFTRANTKSEAAMMEDLMI